MNINELLNSRREALYGTSDESDFVLENMGDITGEFDLDYIEIDEELLLEALEILDDDCFEMVDEAAAMNKIKAASKKAGKKYNKAIDSANEKLYKYILKTYKSPKRIKALIAQCEANIEELEGELKTRDTESKKRKVARILSKSAFAIVFGAAGFIVSEDVKLLALTSTIKKAIRVEKICIKQAKKRLKEIEKENKGKGKKKAVKEGYEYIDLYDDNEDLFVEESYEYDDEDLFDENDLKDIMIESMDIDDPDEYINNALKEYSDESMALVGEMYIDELIVEEAVSMCEDYDELENIEEAFKENVKSKVGKAKATIVNLAKKFAAWIQGLIGSLSTLFVSGEKLVSKYKGKIIEEYNSRGQRIKVKTYKYSHKPEQLKSVLNGILDSNNIGSDMKEAKKSEETMKSIKENAVKCIRSDEKKEYRVSELGINNILELAGDKKKIIKALQDVNKEMQKMFKKGIDTIKEDQGKSESELNKDQAKNAINAVKYASKCSTAAVNAYISEVRSANRACTAIVKRLLNTKKAPNTPDAKGIGGPTE